MLRLYFEAQLEVVCVVGDAVMRLWKRLNGDGLQPEAEPAACWSQLSPPCLPQAKVTSRLLRLEKQEPFNIGGEEALALTSLLPQQPPR